MRFALVSLALCLTAGSAHALEIFLASTERCNSCALYDRAAQQRGYGRVLRYDGGTGTTIVPILKIDKGVLAEDVASQLPEAEGPKNPNWDITLTVIVLDDRGRVLKAGNIAESADNNELRHSNAVMFPPAAPPAGDPSLAHEDLYTPFFASHWNLEYFVDVAVGRTPPRPRTPLVDLASSAPVSVGRANVVLWGSAATPLDNALFVPTRIAEIRSTLAGAGLGALRYFTLFGHGPGVEGNDTSYVEGGATRFRRASVSADFGADAASLNAMLTGVRRAQTARTLLVQVGHSGPTGSPLWGHGLTLAPQDLAPIERDAPGSMIMVSGACNGGMYAQYVGCGFFAAHPDVVASGCQLSQDALVTSDDYLRLFFREAAGSAAPAPKRGRAAPATTLNDAHWRASAQLEDHQLSYTTTDALIDAYFASHADDLPAELTVAEIRALVRLLGPAEVAAFEALAAGLAPEASVALTGYVDANHAAQAKLVNARELSSADRNRIVALPYKLMVPMLARRAVYAGLRANDPAFTAAAACERQSLQSFFRPAATKAK
jgi:hypothetical protein